MERRYGYCCINLSLAKDKVSTNRGMVKRTFNDKGIEYASELALKNVVDLREILEWNSDNGILMYRMSSDIFPWCSEYEISELPDYSTISDVLKSCGLHAKATNQRITFHPSPYGVLASENPDVVRKAIKEINQHAEMFDLMGLDQTHFYPINIHINTAKPSKEEAAERFCQNFKLLSESAKKRLVVEVDDKKSQYTSEDLYEMVYKKVGIPITFDYLHNKCNPGSLSEGEALSLCLSSWPENIAPITHYSDSRKIYEDESCKDVAHSDWIWGNVETYGLDFDIEFEVKMKDLALLKYIENKKKNFLHS
jgi:UV DNA damage endonuclease